jgi:hypothetical protein
MALYSNAFKTNKEVGRYVWNEQKGRGLVSSDEDQVTRRSTGLPSEKVILLEERKVP